MHLTNFQQEHKMEEICVPSLRARSVSMFVLAIPVLRSNKLIIALF
jgi:hypothetical protein